MLLNFILKTTSFCNLNCSYCYMFNSADRAFERQPKYMDPDVAAAALRAIRRVIEAKNDGSVDIVLHGGEPTLWPIASFEQFFAEIGRMRADGLRFGLGMQSNLWRKPSVALLRLLRKHGAVLSASLDGPKAHHDAHRVDLANKGTYDKTLANVLAILYAGYGDIFGGFLCVMQPDIPPDDFLAWVDSLPVTRVSLIWPLDYNQEHPPWEDSGEAAYAAAPRYGAWASRLFEAWWRLDRPEIDIAVFHRAVEARLGGRRKTDILGASSFHSAVVDTDGAIALSDYFRTSADGATRTGYSVLTDDFAALATDTRIAGLRRAAEELPARCRSCQHRDVCGGGTLSGRLDGTGSVTARPSVLCHDHMLFFDTVARRVDAAAAADTRRSAPEMVAL